MSDVIPPEDTALGTQSAALEVGRRVFRQYVLKRFLGRGPLGSAWLVVHEGIGRELSMRFVPEAWLHDDQVIARLREAAVHVLEITHPGLVGILDFARDPQAAAIVSKYVEGESALDAKAQRPQRCFEVDMLRPWLHQVCEALDFAWRMHKAIHGDLNPANLLVTPLSDMKVSDFGLARNLFDLTGPGGGPLIAVSPSYLSPERMRGEPVTVADDVYGLGATIYDLLTSKPPFFRGEADGKPAPTMADRRVELGIGGELIPTEWEEVIAACLAPQPGDRPVTVREVGERLRVLKPLPAGVEVPMPTVLPRPHETVVDYRPPSTQPGPAPVYPSSEVTADMEPPTMQGRAAEKSAVPSLFVPPPPPATAPDASLPPQEVAPATIDESLDFEETMMETPLSASSSSGRSAPVESSAPSPTPPSMFVPPPPSQPAPMEDDANATMVGASAPSSEPSSATPFSPPPSSAPQPSEDDTNATYAAEETPRPGHVPSPPPVAASFVPPAPLQPSEDDANATYAAEETPPPVRTPVPEPSPTPSPAAASAQPGDDDVSATYAAEETPPPVRSPAATPPPAPLIPMEDLEQTLLEVPPSPPPPIPAEDFEQTLLEVPPAPVAPPPPPPAAPPVPPPMPPSVAAQANPNLEDSVTMPTPVRHPSPPMESRLEETPRPPAPTTPSLPPSPPSEGIPKWLLAAGGGLILVVIVAALAWRKGDSTVSSDPAQPTPEQITPAPATPTPTPATPPPAPLATPPPPPQARTVQASEVAKMIGPVTDARVLVGSFKVGTVTTALGSNPANITMRPTDPAWSGKIRIVGSLMSSGTLPAEGSVVELTAESGYLIRQVREGADGQITVFTEKR